MRRPALTSEKVAGATSWLMGNSAPPMAPFQPSLCVPLEQDVARSGDTDSQLTQREACSQGAPGGALGGRGLGAEGHGSKALQGTIRSCLGPKHDLSTPWWDRHLANRG